MAENRSFRPQQSPRKWSPLDLAKLRLSGKPWSKDDPKLRPSLQVYFGKDGNPRIRVYMNDGSMGQASTSINLDPPHFFGILEDLKRIAANETPNRHQWGVKALFKNGRQMEKPEIVAKVSVGRDSEGVVYIAVATDTSKTALFPFGPNFWFELLGADGEKLHPREASDIMATSWVNWMGDLYVQLLANLDQSEISAPRNGAMPSNNSGGYEQRQPGSASNWTQEPRQEAAPAARLDFDDDIAF